MASPVRTGAGGSGAGTEAKRPGSRDSPSLSRAALLSTPGPRPSGLGFTPSPQGTSTESGGLPLRQGQRQERGGQARRPTPHPALLPVTLRGAWGPGTRQKELPKLQESSASASEEQAREEQPLLCLRGRAWQCHTGSQSQGGIRGKPSLRNIYKTHRGTPISQRTRLPVPNECALQAGRSRTKAALPG